ncbi:MAG TPA: hypothetical protein PLL69_09410 [Gemmatimonadales bacterium]|nr:hypothetical protein [Gemmatimonadales bacterium]
MVETSESIWYRYRWLWIPLAVLLTVWIALTLTRTNAAVEAAWCRSEYAKATISADTARVDASIPPFVSSNSAPRVACGVLRGMGKL